MATQKQIAEHIDLSDRQVRRLVSEGVLPASKGHGGMDIDACRTAYINYLRHLSSKPNIDESPDEESLEYERYRLTKAQADNQELKNAISKQEVVPVDFAAFALSTVAAEASGILDSLPLNLIRKHPELTRVQQENIKRELAKAMNAMSRLSDKIPEMLDDYIRDSDN